MRVVAPRSWARAVAGAFFALLALAWIAPGSADAGCDHPGDRPRLRGDLASLDLGGDRDQDQAPAPRPDKPCTGALCSGNPAPLSTSTPPTLPDPDARAVLAGPSPVAAPARGPRIVETSSPRPIHNPSSVFHPPPRSA